MNLTPKPEKVEPFSHYLEILARTIPPFDIWLENHIFVSF